MTDKKNEELEKEEAIKKGGEQDLEYCTTAPSAEHARATNDDEPCDDGRG